MPESPRTRFRRNRAAKVAGDLGRIAGKPVEPTSQPRKPTAPTGFRTGSGRHNLEIFGQVASELGELHQWRIRWGPAHGDFRAWCTCQQWEATRPSTTQLRARTAWKDHLRREIAAEAIHRQHPRKRRRFP